MKRSLFLAAAGAAAAAGCGRHGAGLIPIAQGAGGTQGDYEPATALPALPVIGEVARFDGTTAPPDWAICDGSTVAVTANPTLAKLLGNDGTSFRLPAKRKYAHVIAIAGASPRSPQELAAIFAKRANAPTRLPAS